MVEGVARSERLRRTKEAWMDVHSPSQRRFNMARVRNRDTKPELAVRRKLHGGGFRFRLHVQELPGRPDIVLPKHRTVVFVHGCFWHGHACRAGRLPGTRTEFWAAKVSGNHARDVAQGQALHSSGWRVFTVWECAMRGRERQPADALLERFAAWLASGDPFGQFSSRQPNSRAGGDRLNNRTARLPPAPDTE